MSMNDWSKYCTLVSLNNTSVTGSLNSILGIQKVTLVGLIMLMTNDVKYLAFQNCINSLFIYNTALLVHLPTSLHCSRLRKLWKLMIDEIYRQTKSLKLDLQFTMPSHSTENKDSH